MVALKRPLGAVDVHHFHGLLAVSTSHQVESVGEHVAHQWNDNDEDTNNNY